MKARSFRVLARRCGGINANGSVTTIRSPRNVASGGRGGAEHCTSTTARDQRAATWTAERSSASKASAGVPNLLRSRAPAKDAGE